MKLHEYQVKRLFARHGIPTPAGRVAASALEAQQIAVELGKPVILKVQVLINGRGKSGGILLAKTPVEAFEVATSLFSLRPKDLPVRKVLVDEVIPISQEIYLGIIIDRSLRLPVLMATAEGGANIEELILDKPEKVFRVLIDPLVGLHEYQVRELAASIDLPRSNWRAFASIAFSLWQIFIETNALMIEINPLVLTPEEKLVALDGKIDLDENAINLHPDLAELRDTDVESPLEAEARKFNMTYLHHAGGDIGVIVNGAGLCMATLDTLHIYDGRPANFMDIGKDPTPSKIYTAFKIVSSNSEISVILFNIFGGLIPCDEIAQGILTAISQKPGLPAVVRLDGVRAAEGCKLLEKSGVTVTASLAEAAARAIALAHGEKNEYFGQ
ncbi:MAG TPA: ADP-forming succinate--CoA ligase subunit beta [Anaerolineaceae bacterium]|nr:ADP-forming succinate--CoA ligase subunit beta [Anaerolineaceae bacterium]HPN53092.1 ADP-forming succinate--CoA ligase subunit beta [Anaerolineaceae bacterium]